MFITITHNLNRLCSTEANNITAFVGYCDCWNSRNRCVTSCIRKLLLWLNCTIAFMADWQLKLDWTVSETYVADIAW